MPLLLFACGLALTAYSGWRAWVDGRAMLAPAAHLPEQLRRRTTDRGETPAAPASPAAELRHALWQLALAVGWLLVAMIGLYMLTVASEAGL
ncbi:MAG: hypothetical protein ACRDGL_01255 [Candidatus Limnocylindrales bacterium]